MAVIKDKKELDWKNIGFTYHQTDYRYVADFKDGRVSERPVWYDELGNFDEAGVCGTAAVVTPVGEVVGPTEKTVFPGSSKCMGPVLKQLYDTLTGIQMGTIEAPEGWIRTII